MAGGSFEETFGVVAVRGMRATDTGSFELLRAESGQKLPEIRKTIDRRMVEFAAGLPQGDDQTVVLLRRA